MKNIFLASMLMIVPFSAHAFELALPVQCELGTECFLQNYVDTDPGAEYSDYQCGKMSYNGHDGTDFRLPNFVAMDKGVNVIAAAPGKVLGFRDQVEDTGLMNPDIKNKECGNGVLLEHAGGWQTQYCHLKKGSIRVAKGQEVKTGDVLGQIGLSGQTEFPHVHLSVRSNGKKIDPFTGLEIGKAMCNADTSKAIWAKDIAPKLTYGPTHLLGMGLSSAEPNKEGARRGQFQETEMLLDAPLLTMWVDIMGTKADDQLSLALISPDGTVLFQKEEIFAKPKAQQFYYIGRKRVASAWPAGIYTGKAVLSRGGQVVFSEERKLIARP